MPNATMNVERSRDAIAIVSKAFLMRCGASPMTGFVGCCNSLGNVVAAAETATGVFVGV